MHIMKGGFKRHKDQPSAIFEICQGTIEKNSFIYWKCKVLLNTCGSVLWHIHYTKIQIKSTESVTCQDNIALGISSLSTLHLG